MFDLVGKIFSGLTSLAQEKLALDFLESDPGMAIFAGGVVILTLIILPIGPSWMRTESLIGKMIAGAAAVAMLVGIMVLGLDFAIEKAKQLGHGAPTGTHQTHGTTAPAHPSKVEVPPNGA